MAIVTSEGLAARVCRALHEGNTPLWHPALTADLAALAWQELGRHVGLAPATYATARVLRSDLSAVPCIATSLQVKANDGAILGPINVEVLPDELASRYADSNHLL